MHSTQIKKALFLKLNFTHPPPPSTSRKDWGGQEYIGHVSNYKTPVMLFFLLT